MDVIGRRLLFSASDLVNHSACEYLTSLELASALRREVRPDFMTPDTAARVRRGFEHEERFLASLVAAGNRTYAVETDRTSNDGLLLNAVQTAVALQSDDIDIVYQPTFFELDAEFAWQGHGDFAIRNERGVFEIWDTKLARSVSTKMLVQLGKYSMMLGAAQGSMPEQLHIVLGDGRRESFRVDEITPFVRAFERKFTADIRSAVFPTRPEPVKHCDVCARREHCEERWIDEDHLSLVWNLDKRTRRLLEDAGITTVRQLASTGLGTNVPGLSRSVFGETVAQAALQVRGRAAGELIYELRRPEPAKGYAVLPRPRPSDLFLDFEFNDLEVIAGDVRGKGRPSRFAYLFAVAEASDPEQPTVETFWADTTNAEKENILALARRIAEARALDREMHVYHWGSVDRSIMRSLLDYHGAQQIDLILDAFVDMYAIFEQGGRLSARSLGLKEAEKLWSPQARASEGVDGASSIALREQYRHSSARAERAELRRQLEEYCSEDTVQLVAGRSYLLQQTEELFRRRAFPLAVDVRSNADRATEVTPDDLEDGAAGTRIGDLLVAAAERLRAGLPKDPARDRSAQASRRMLADLMDWHRRERRPEWSELFALRREVASRTPSQRAAFLREHDVAIGELEFHADLSDVEGRRPFTSRDVGFNPDKSVLERYLFPLAQEHELKADLRAEDPGTGEPVTIVDIDDTLGAIVVKRSRAKAFDQDGRWAPLRNLIPADPPTVKPLQTSLLRVAERVLDGKVVVRGSYGLALQLLRGVPPRVRGQRTGAPLVRPGEDQTEAVVRLVQELDHGVLAVQGPPGSGKTYAAARAVVEYLKANPDTDARAVRIGVMASSHKVIGNLLEEIGRQAAEAGIDPGVIHLNRGVDRADADLVRTVKGADAMANAAKYRTAHVFGGTAWYFAREEHTAVPFDLLVVDEAGQISLADTIAAAPAARNMLLVGDPAQLTQPIRGAHPERVKVSALGRYLDGRATIAADRGVFFEYTRRLGANCDFVSQMFYDGKLHPHPTVPAVRIIGFPGIAGLEFVPVEHLGNRPNQKSSPEEAERVAEIVATLLASCQIEVGGVVRPVTAADILVVAPFRRQVDRIRRTVANDDLSVLTVDKAQGQEAAIVIYSMARSAANREEFLLSRNRMNVAISRAQALSIVVASPKVFEPLVTTPDALRRMGTHLRFIEVAADRAAREHHREQLLLLDFGARVRHARTQLGFTQQKFAAAVGVSLTTIKRIERGRASVDAVDPVVQYLGWDPTRVADVLDGTDRAALAATSTAVLVASMAAPVADVEVPLRG